MMHANILQVYISSKTLFQSINLQGGDMNIFDSVNTWIESFAYVISKFEEVVMNVVSISFAQGFPSNLIGQIESFLE